MIEGNIIKFYREKAKLTQKELGSGICSVTHLSKIERGLTEYSSETILHIADRLGIDLNKELAKLYEIKELLDRWHEVMIKEGLPEVEVIKKELENAPLLHISNYKHFYSLLQIRYELIHYNLDKAQEIINDVRKIEFHLSDYERNLLKQILGMYYIAKSDYVKAIDTLKTIKQNEYNNPEYYYHLAVAYHNLNSQIMCYHYAEKALNYFKKSNNFLRVIDTEMLMLVQLQFDQHHDFKETVKQYEALIESCVTCNAIRRKSKLLHNLAFLYYVRKNYQKASELYKESCSIKNKKSSEYLLSFEGYIRCSFEAGLLSKAKLIQLTNEGLRIATEMHQELFMILFNLLLYLIKGRQDQYFHYLYTEGLPYYRKYGFAYLVQRSEKELFHYFYKKNEVEKALELAFLSFNKDEAVDGESK
ncbi:helix-turn-helix transcriptional regulator [Bacillus sp. CH30_1T]|uniref:helix-turn-helix domain-containing protein n=1 Tax=Bacillus sp. CH30_1T TaxID=2604836 RepID=UPI0011F0340C|nr:helix-turn-helix transcriptional regulator [Bacillus sp. CH30_1T]KAA0566669.1 helix-turn-helix transcriptional regulator [Bacillus sp. CH30_1T]